MKKSVGGRGHKASYSTIVMRVPVDLKSQIEELVEQFREGSTIEAGIEMLTAELGEIIGRYQSSAKSTRDHTISNKLIKELQIILLKHTD